MKNCSDNNDQQKTNPKDDDSQEINLVSNIVDDVTDKSTKTHRHHHKHSHSHSHHSHRHRHSHSHSHHSHHHSHRNSHSKKSNQANDITDNSAGTHRHIKKRYSFSIDKKDDNVPVAIYRKRKEPKPAEPVKTTNKKKKSPAFKVLIGLGTTVISLLLVVSIVLTVLVINGKKELIDNNEKVEVKAPTTASVEGEYVIYDGKKYKYNNKVTTILFSGIDKHTNEHNEEVHGAAGQADSLFAMALNTETGKYKIMAISRDTMIDVNIIDVKGNFEKTQKMQICLAHAYGDGKEISNENLKASVSRLFFGIPINSYISIDLDALYVLNDAVGGVNVNVIEDLSHRDPALVEGANVTLTAGQAEIYVRYRDVSGDENQNNLRMARQINFITSFINQSLAMTKEDIQTPLNLFNQIKPYTRTDIDPSKITYLASVFLNSGFSVENNYIKIPGKTVAGERYAEYYTDTEEFYKIILDTYYTRVE